MNINNILDGEATQDTQMEQFEQYGQAPPLFEDEEDENERLLRLMGKPDPVEQQRLVLPEYAPTLDVEVVEPAETIPLPPPVQSVNPKKRTLPFTDNKTTTAASKRRKDAKDAKDAKLEKMSAVRDQTPPVSSRSASRPTPVTTTSAVSTTTASSAPPTPVLKNPSSTSASTSAPAPPPSSSMPFSLKETAQKEVAVRTKVNLEFLDKVFSDYHTALFMIEFTSKWKRDLYAEMEKSGSLVVSGLPAEDASISVEKTAFKVALKKAVDDYVDTL